MFVGRHGEAKKEQKVFLHAKNLKTKYKFQASKVHGATFLPMLPGNNITSALIG